MPLVIQPIVSAPFAENSYVVRKPDRRECLIIDPGLEPDLILSFLEENELRPAALLNTHGHADHIGGNADMKRRFPNVPLIIGINEAPLLTDPYENLSASLGLPVTSPPADRLVHEGETLDLAGIPLLVIEVPGHSPGHVVYLYRAETPHALFGGDVLFQRGIGRYDFPNSDGPLLFRGIREKLFTLPPDTIVYPGHGPETTISEEKRFNPFVGEGA